MGVAHTRAHTTAESFLGDTACWIRLSIVPLGIETRSMRRETSYRCIANQISQHPTLSRFVGAEPMQGMLNVHHC